VVSANFRHLASLVSGGQISALKCPTFHTRDRCAAAEKRQQRALEEIK
jgi:hypothetical protein